MRKTAPKTTNAKKAASKSTDATPSPAQNSPKSESSDNLNLSEIRELIELIAEKQFTEFELERGAFRLRLQKGGVKPPAELPVQVVSAPPTVVAAENHPAIPAPASVARGESAPAPDEDLVLITSPIVGTFYRAASPTADPFVKIGDPIEAGKTVCIIEAMKLMNEIPAETSGTIAKIFVENGQPVEFGQPLFGVKM